MLNSYGNGRGTAPFITDKTSGRPPIHTFGSTAPRGAVLPFDLLSDAQFCDNGAVSLDIRLNQVAQQVPAFADHLQKTTAGVVVVLIRLQVFRQRVDPAGQDRDLDFRRTGVALVGLVGVDNDGLLVFRDHSNFNPFLIFASRAAKYRLKGGRKLSAAVKRSIILPHSPPLVKHKIMEKYRLPEKRA